MTNLPVWNSTRAVALFTVLLVLPLLVSLQGCTDLEESPVSSITPDNFYQTEAEALSGLAAVYNVLGPGGGDWEWDYYNLSQVTSDEMIVPTRGSDWDDGGRWLEIQRHAWTPVSPAGLTDIGGVWTVLFRGVTRANVLLDALQNTVVPNQAVIEAEAQALRALYYYYLMDMFGGVPIVDTTSIEARPRNTSAEVFQFIDNAQRHQLQLVHGRAGGGAVRVRSRHRRRGPHLELR
jgi:hypothetical protein